MQKCVVVAIDGPAGAGKSTVARSLAARLGFVYIDTGAMYRAVALWASRAGVAEDDVHKLEQLAREAQITFAAGADAIILNGEDVTCEIRTAPISELASKISAVPGVRKALADKQRELGEGASVVMEGRDIGTVVFPAAQVKIFLDAPVSVRADRRTRELKTRGGAVDPDRTERDIAERDGRDRERAEAPLVQAPDAFYIDSAGLTAEEVVEAILRVVRERTANGKEYSR